MLFWSIFNIQVSCSLFVSVLGYFAAEISAPWTVTLKAYKSARLMVDDRKMISIVHDKKVHSFYDGIFWISDVIISGAISDW